MRRVQNHSEMGRVMVVSKTEICFRANPRNRMLYQLEFYPNFDALGWGQGTALEILFE